MANILVERIKAIYAAVEQQRCRDRAQPEAAHVSQISDIPAGKVEQQRCRDRAQPEAAHVSQISDIPAGEGLAADSGAREVMSGGRVDRNIWRPSGRRR
jgi:hypothetical protein